MRLIAIDASPINGGPASYAVDVSASAAEESGAQVVRIRLYDIVSYACTQCAACAQTGRCTTRDGLLSHASRILADADTLILGAPARLSSSKHGPTAMLKRLLGAYVGATTTRGVLMEGVSPSEKRAAVIASCATPLGVPIEAGGMARAARRFLTDAGVTLVPCSPVPLRFTRPAARDTTRECAADLGTSLALMPWRSRSGSGDGGASPGISRVQRKARRGRSLVGIKASYGR
jgi:hypothetical protein